MGLKQASGSDPSEDILPVGGFPCLTSTRLGWCPPRGTVTTAACGAVQQEYAPFGIPSSACVWAWRASRTRTRGSPCSHVAVPSTTVWIVDPALSPTTPGYFPIINASTTDFSRPFAMHLPPDEVASGQALQMQVRHLQFLTGEKTLRDRQLWGLISES